MATKTDDERLSMFREFLVRFRERGKFGAVTPHMIRAFEKEIPDAVIPASLCQYWLNYGCGDMPELAATAKVFPRPADYPPPVYRLLSPPEIADYMSSPAMATIPSWVRYEGGDDDDADGDQERRPDIERDDVWKYLVPIATDAVRPGVRWICMLRHFNAVNDLPIYYYDEAANSIADLAPGFDDLLQGYLRLPKAG